jgi:ubiquinone/menaquinone biosynthesis C-methylase UbiE
MTTAFDLVEYRASESERARTVDLLRLLPSGRRSILDIGARDGHFSRLLAQRFPEVTAIDLETPRFEMPGVSKIVGDVTRLPFRNQSFDCVFCAEVLEHVPNVQQACTEIVRVARHEIVVGVPYRQDTRVGRTTCASCGRTNPPWGHVNSFDEQQLETLFRGSTPIARSLVGSTRDVTNTLSTFMMDLAGNPWGTYDQHEGCIHCGRPLVAPSHRALWQRMSSALAACINRVQMRWTSPHGNWIHLVLQKS